MVHILSLIIVTLVKKVILLFITMFLEMNFFGEARLHRIPEVTYEYDCSELKDLESLLAKNLQATLHKIRERI